MQILWLAPLQMTVSAPSPTGEETDRQIILCRLIVPDIGIRIAYTTDYIQCEQPEKLVWKDTEVVSVVEASSDFIKLLQDYLNVQRGIVEHIGNLQESFKDPAKNANN